jgi:uncharacterized damage-inducible protein DinB
LNHLLVTDPIWMRWFIGEGDAPNRLDAILFETFDELRAAREAENRRIVDFVEGSTIGVSPDDRIPPRLIAGRIRATTGSAAGALVQPPQPPPRSNPRFAG